MVIFNTKEEICLTKINKLYEQMARMTSINAKLQLLQQIKDLRAQLNKTKKSK